MNDLEKYVMQGALKAHQQYEVLTGGWWLGHGPESFIHTLIAQQIGKLGHEVYVDASLKKIKQDIGQKRRGRPSKNSRQRPDISVWYKADDALRAVIEVKRAWHFSPVSTDAKKLRKYLKQKGSATTGYLLIYSEMKGKLRRKKLHDRFRGWANRLSWKLVHQFVRTAHDDQDWAWGFVLMRFIPAD